MKYHLPKFPKGKGTLPFSSSPFLSNQTRNMPIPSFPFQLPRCQPPTFSSNQPTNQNIKMPKCYSIRERERYQCKDTCSYTSSTWSYNRLIQRYACRRVWGLGLPCNKIKLSIRWQWQNYPYATMETNTWKINVDLLNSGLNNKISITKHDLTFHINVSIKQYTTSYIDHLNSLLWFISESLFG